MKIRWRRIGTWLLAPVLLVAAVGYGIDALMRAHFNPDPPAREHATPRDALEAQRQDLAYFRRLIALDRAFADSARTEAERRIEALEQRGEAIELDELRVALLGIVALADNGHSALYSAPGGRTRLVPVRVAPFADGLRVLRARHEHADLLGARVVAIDGHPVEEALDVLSALRGGTVAWRRAYAELLIMAPGILHAAGLAPDPSRSTWRLALPDGTSVERSLEAYQPGDDEPLAPSARWLSEKQYADEPDGWQAWAGDGAALPLSLRDFDRVFRRVRVGNSCVLLVQMKSTQDENGERIADFLRDTESELRARPPCALILDQRFNGGGDYTKVWGFARRLPGLLAPAGRIYALTGTDTFSAAITLLGFVKQAAGSRVVVLGEPVGDRLRFWSEGASGCLPNAPLCVRYATGLHDYHAPCRDWERCYWLNWLFPVRVDDLAPDEPIAMRFADYASGHDPVFERALELAGAPR